jgi:hypothetical protein
MKIMQYCSVCKAEYEMEVVPTADGEDDGVVWLQCPSCRGFLPKVRSSADFARPAAPRSAETADDVDEPDADAAEFVEEPVPATPAVAAPEPDAVDPLADVDLETAKPYRSWETYAEGDVIHHLAWDDYGVVLAKEILPGNRRVLKVHFSQAGIVRLIEQNGERP